MCDIGFGLDCDTVSGQAIIIGKKFELLESFGQNYPEEFDVSLVSDQQFFESIWQSVSGEMILLATNLWHFLGTLHSSSGEAINTSDLSVRIRLTNFKINS